MAGCVHLLQVWAWEHTHVGRPTLRVPYPTDIDGLSVGFRWNEGYVREMPLANIRVYRDELDGLLQSQVIWEPYGHQIRLRVAEICLQGEEIWLARVPMICWKRVEWYLPDRVFRQFGLPPSTDVAPMDPSFVRVDGRGKADVDWVVYHHSFIAQWEQRRDSIVTVDSSLQDLEPAINRYMRWYRSWASLYMLKAPTVPPDTYYPRAPGERLMREHILKTEDIFQRYFGRDEDTEHQKSFNDYEELLVDLRRNMHISDTRYRDTDIPGTSTSAQSGVPSMDAGPSSTPVVGQTAYTFSQPPQYSYQDAMWSQMHPWHAATPSPYGPPSYHMPPPFGVYHGYSLPTQGSTDVPPVTDLGDSQHYVAHVEAEAGHQQHHLRDRPRQPPTHYTPGSDAIPPRRHRRR